jgi:hypothetical protein
MELKPFETIRIKTSEDEERHVSALLSDVEGQGLICTSCGSTRFKVEVFIKTSVEMLVRGELKIVTSIAKDVGFVNRVIECAVCKSKKFTTIDV